MLLLLLLRSSCKDDVLIFCVDLRLRDLSLEVFTVVAFLILVIYFFICFPNVLADVAVI